MDAFALVRVMGFCVNTTLLMSLTIFMVPPYGFTPHFLENIAKATATVGSFVCNFVGYRYVVFGHFHEGKSEVSGPDIRDDSSVGSPARLS
jgi:hypothetical protein